MHYRYLAHDGTATLQATRGTLRAPQDDEVLIAVAAFGINRPDLLQRQGLYPPPAGASPVLGLEVAGTVLRCGNRVAQWQPGDRVCALVNGGGYSDHCLAPAAQCLPWPTGYDAAEAACLPEALFTVWHNLFQRGHLASGESVLIQGGSSGIGSLAIQLARLAGARVVTTAGSDDKRARCLEVGATLAIGYHEPDSVETVLAATDGRGVEVVLDILGGEAVSQHIKLAATDGRIINIAALNGSRAEVNVGAIMMKRLTLTGSTLRAQSAAQKAAIARDIRQHAWHWIESGQCRPVIDSRYAFTEADAAHRRMQSRAHFGKMAVIL